MKFMIFVLDSQKELYRKAVNCNGVEMSLKRHDGEILLGFASQEQSEVIVLTDEELRMVYNHLLKDGSSTLGFTGLNVSMAPTSCGRILSFMSFKDEDFGSVRIFMNDNELRYFKILLTEQS